jgi:hypothetical protein
VSAIRWTFAGPRPWLIAVAALAAYALLYLFVAKAVVFDASAGFSRFGALPLLIVAPDLSLGHVARWLDPVFVLYLTDSIVLAPSAPVLISAAVLGMLIGVNAAVTAEAVIRRPPACERGGAWWLVAVLPSFLASFSCCAPTVLLLVGATFAGAAIAIVPWVVPVAVALLLASLAWSLRRLERTTVLVVRAAT